MGQRRDIPIEQPLAGLSPPRFGLPAIFWGTALVAVWLAVLKWQGPAVAVVLLFAFVIVAAHVAGNAIGSRLRDRGTQHAAEAWRKSTPGGPEHSDRHVEPHHYAPVTQLSYRVSLGWLPLVVTLMGGIAGACVGSWLLLRMHPESATPLTLSFGGLAIGSVSAIFSFWVFSLLQVFLGAWWQAHRHGNRS